MTPTVYKKGVTVVIGAEKQLSEAKPNARTDHEAEGDNPGVGGMPDEKPLSDETTNSHTERETEGDNPRVGGMPAAK